MLRRISLSLVLLWTTMMQAADGFVVPPFLVPGDTVAIISPSSEATQEMVDAGSKALRKWGLVPLPAPNVLCSWHGFAGTAQQRLDDLLWALRNPQVKAIIATRGGDGAPHVLAHLPVDTLAKYPKWIIGFSDVTALLCAEARAGVASVHASMCEALGYRVTKLRRIRFINIELGNMKPGDIRNLTREEIRGLKSSDKSD